MKLNLKKGSEGGTDLSAIPEQRLDFVIDNTKFFEASTGTDMLEVRFSALGDEFKNRKVWRNFPLTQSAVYYITELLKAVKSPLAGSEDLDVEQIPAAIMNKKVSGYVTTRKLNSGKVVNDIEKLKPVQDSHIPQPKREPQKEDIFS